MDCKRTRELIGPFVDGELPLDLSGAVVRHLKACTACRSQADELLNLGRAVGSLAGDAPLGLGARILAEARAGQVPSSARGWTAVGAWPRVAALFAGAAAVTLLFSPPVDRTMSERSAPGSDVHRLLTESQSELELAGSFEADFRLLAARPEGRLMHESIGAKR